MKRLLSLIFMIGLALPARAEVTPEYKLKAALVFNFAKFVDWPPASFADATSPVIIGVLGDDPFEEALDDTIRGRTANGRPLIIRRSHRLEDLRDCHLLFICASEKARQSQITASLLGKAVLTVSDSDNFLEQGGMIKVTLVDRRPHVEIDAGAAERAGLKIQAQLLELATVTRKERS